VADVSPGRRRIGVLGRRSSHSEPGLGDFSIAFMVVSAIALLAPVISVRFDADAAAELTGQRRRGA